jgi:hypothetical protein
MSVDRPTFHLPFVHVGAKCPACSYVFTKGFSPVEMPGDDDKDRPGGPITPCTRCRRILQLRDDGLHLLTEVDLMLMTDKERQDIAFLEKMLNLYTQDFS